MLRLELPPPAVGALSLGEALDRDYLVVEGAARRKRRRRGSSGGEEEDEHRWHHRSSTSSTSSSTSSSPAFTLLPRAALLSLGRAGVTRQALARAQAQLAAAATAAAMSVLVRKEGGKRALLPRPSLSLLRNKKEGGESGAREVFAATAASAPPPLPARLSLALSSAVEAMTPLEGLPARARADAWLSDPVSFEGALSSAALAAVSSSDSSSSIDLLLPTLALEPELASRALGRTCGWLQCSSGHPRLWRLAEKIWRSSESCSARRFSRRSNSRGEAGEPLGRLRAALLRIGTGEKEESDAPLVVAAAAAADAAEEAAATSSPSSSSSSSPLWLALAPARTACLRCLELLLLPEEDKDEDKEAETKAAAASLAARFLRGCRCCLPSSARGFSEARELRRVSEALLLAASRAPKRGEVGAAALPWASWLSGEENGNGNENGNGENECGNDKGEGAKGGKEARPPVPPPSPCALLGPWASRVMLPLAWLSSRERRRGGEGEEEEQEEALSLLRRVSKGGGGASHSPNSKALGPAFALNAALEALEWARGRGKGRVSEGVERELEEAVAEAARSSSSV